MIKIRRKNIYLFYNAGWAISKWPEIQPENLNQHLFIDLPDYTKILCINIHMYYVLYVSHTIVIYITFDNFFQTKYQNIKSWFD